MVISDSTSVEKSPSTCSKIFLVARIVARNSRARWHSAKHRARVPPHTGMEFRRYSKNGDQCVEGWLSKRDHRWRQWRTRWCVIEGDQLKFYPSRNHRYTRAKGSVQLRGGTVQPMRLHDGREVVWFQPASGGSHLFCAASSSSRDAWLEVMQAPIEREEARLKAEEAARLAAAKAAEAKAAEDARRAEVARLAAAARMVAAAEAKPTPGDLADRVVRRLAAAAADQQDEEDEEGEEGEEGEEEDEEEEERRLAWIRHFVVRGELAKARALGWSGDVQGLVDMGLEQSGDQVARAQSSPRKPSPTPSDNGSRSGILDVQRRWTLSNELIFMM